MPKYTDEDIRNMSKITCKIAADYLGISPMAVSIGMRNDLLPIGFAIHNEERDRTYSESWSYHIIGERLIAYKYGKTSEVQVQNIEKSLNTIIEQFEEMKKDPNHRNVTLAAKNSTDKVSLPTWAVAYFSKMLPKSVQKNHPSILNQEQAHAVLASLDHAIGQVFLTTFEKYAIDQQEI